MARASAEGPYQQAIDAARNDLEAVVERLDELCLEILHDALEADVQTRPEVERLVTRARNAVERAIGLLSRTDPPAFDE